MPRRKRLDFYGAMHLVSLRGRVGSSIFFDADALMLPAAQMYSRASNLRHFELLLAESCDECASVVHAFAWEPNSASLVVQTQGVPLSSVMGRLCGRYSKYLHDQGKIVGRQRAFQSRYDSKIVAPEYLTHAIRRVESIPVAAGYCKNPLEYPFSSCRRLGDARPPWLAATARTPIRNSEARQPEADYVSALFAHGSKWDQRVVGDRVFVLKVAREAGLAMRTPSRKQIVDAVTLLLNKTVTAPGTLRSLEVLKRALVARYAIRSGAATLTEVGRWFSVTPAALRDGIDRYREQVPYLFNASLEELFGSSAPRVQ